MMKQILGVCLLLAVAACTATRGDEPVPVETTARFRVRLEQTGDTAVFYRVMQVTENLQFTGTQQPAEGEWDSAQEKLKTAYDVETIVPVKSIEVHTKALFLPTAVWQDSVDRAYRVTTRIQVWRDGEIQQDTTLLTHDEDLAGEGIFDATYLAE
ncbi:hypothetical protein [Catalinimonas alkaloidigena]|nr:hypothetical protein [Catalinimonas alkaloidigena]